MLKQTLIKVIILSLMFYSSLDAQKNNTYQKKSRKKKSSRKEKNSHKKKSQKIDESQLRASCHIANIYNITPGDPASLLPVVVDQTGQLGTGPYCFNQNITVQDPNVLLVDFIAPTDGTTSCPGVENDAGTTTFNGNVACLENLTCNENVNLVATNASGTVGVVTVANSPFIHTYGAGGLTDANTFIGSNAGNFSLTGIYNSTLGFNTLENNSAGSSNTALGEHALNVNTSGNNNVASGDSALLATTTGSYNTALGTGALSENITGNNNTALGSAALAHNTTNDNTAVGGSSLYTSTTGIRNTALGAYSLYQNNANDNTAIGYQNLTWNTSGSDNTTLGCYALTNSTTGANNIAIGSSAGSLYTSSESNNLVIGNTGATSESNTIRIGNNTQTACYVSGITGSTTNDVGSSVTVLIDNTGRLGTIPSSRKYKKDIQDIHEASAHLMQLRPVSFKYKNQPDSTPVEYGLIAEEVAQIFPELVVYNNDGQPETVRYHQLPPLLLNEYQHQQKKLNDHDKQLDEIINQLVTREELYEIIERLVLVELEKKSKSSN